MLAFVHIHSFNKGVVELMGEILVTCPMGRVLEILFEDQSQGDYGELSLEEKEAFLGHMTLFFGSILSMKGSRTFATITTSEKN